MKTNTFLAYIILQLIFLTITKAQPTPVSMNGQLQVCGNQLCNQYGKSIQLRGMSTHGIQWYGWNNCITEKSLDALAYDWGSDILRISLYVQEGGYETDPVGFTAQVNRLIQEASDRGMYALVDWHQLSPGDPNYNVENAKKFFADIASVNKNRTNIIYDICNEPNNTPWYRIKEYGDIMIPYIRAIDQDAIILIGTHGWGSMGISDGRNAKDIVDNPLNFENIMYTFHFYAKSHREIYLNELDWASDRLPVFVTEFGTQEYTGDGENDFVMSQKYMDLMRRKKISWTNWNFSDDFRSGAVWKSGTCSSNYWGTEKLKPAGKWIRERMLNPADDFPGGSTSNLPPSIRIDSPNQNEIFKIPTDVRVAVTASDPDGTIAKVEFYVNNNLVFTDYQQPYSYSWSQNITGVYNLSAKAFDNKRASSTSSISIQFIQGTGSCGTIDNWESTTIYHGGDKVAYLNEIYRAKWWTQNQNPAENSGRWEVWEKLGGCNTLNDHSKTPIAGSSKKNSIRIYPNPFEENTSLILQVDSTDLIQLDIFNYGGQKIQSVVEKMVLPGEYRFDIDGSGFSPGLYFVNYRIGNQRKIIPILKK